VAVERMTFLCRATREAQEPERIRHFLACEGAYGRGVHAPPNFACMADATHSSASTTSR
jgi:hypothetical protein